MKELTQTMLFARDAAARDAENDLFAALVKAQAGFVFRVVFAVLRNAQDAEDVVQETFLKLYRSGTWREMRDERAFLARAAWRLAVDRRRGRHGFETLPETAATAADPEQSALAGDRDAWLRRLIDALPEELRQPLVLSAIEELTSKQIGTILGLPEGTVRTRLLRARQLLKQKAAILMENRHDQ